MTAPRVPSPDVLVRVRNHAQCTVCRHKKRMEIETALLRSGATMRGVGKQYGVSRMAVARHRKHVLQGMQRLAQVHGFSLQGTLEQQMRAIGEAFARLAGLCESIGQFSVAISAGREARETVNLLHSWITPPPPTNVQATQVNVVDFRDRDEDKIFAKLLKPDAKPRPRQIPGTIDVDAAMESESGEQPTPEEKGKIN